MNVYIFQHDDDLILFSLSCSCSCNNTNVINNLIAFAKSFIY